MKKIPPELLLYNLIEEGRPLYGELEEIGSAIAFFHNGASVYRGKRYGGIGTIMNAVRENFEQIRPFCGITFEKGFYEQLVDYTMSFIDEHTRTFQERRRGGNIREGHGDLHSQHICLTRPPVIFDCIEFNDRFRYGDVASEVAFLAMDLDRMARSDLSREFVAAYSAASGDGGIERLLPFYGCYRAVVRGKVEGFKLGDDLVPAEEKASALRLARCYFELARRYATGRGLLVLMSGVTGSGKSTIASALAPLLAGRIISSDVVRKELAGISPVEHRYIPYGSGIYSPERTRQTYQEMLRRAEPVLQGGGCAILDAAFLRGEERIRARDVALRHGSRAVVVECVAPFEVTLRRLAERQAGVSVSDGRAEILERQLPDVEAVAEFAEEDHLRINVSRPLGDILEEIWRKL